MLVFINVLVVLISWMMPGPGAVAIGRLVGLAGAGFSKASVPP